MFPIQEQMSASIKASLEANLAMYAALTNKALESVDSLVRLNMSTAKAVLEESAAATRQVLAARDAEEYAALVRAQAKPGMDKAIAYSGHLFSIASDTHSEFSGAAEAQMAAVSRKVNELVEHAVANAPPGSEAVMAMVKSALGDRGNGYEQMTRNAKQAMEVLESNMNTVLSQFARVAAKA